MPSQSHELSSVHSCALAKLLRHFSHHIHKSKWSRIRGLLRWNMASGVVNHLRDYRRSHSGERFNQSHHRYDFPTEKVSLRCWDEAPRQLRGLLSQARPPSSSLTAMSLRRSQLITSVYISINSRGSLSIQHP